MPMYVWSSEALKEWTPGNIVVQAKSVNTARKKAIKAFDKYYHYDKKTMEQFEIDVSVEPTIEEDGVFWVHGSA